LAKVTATSPALVVPQSTLTTAPGYYRFPSLPPGTYTVTMEAPGFAVTKHEGIVITAGFSATVDVMMVIAGQMQTVAVTAEAPGLDTENTKVQNTFSAESLKDIPNGRDMWSLIAIAPGLSVNRFDVGGATVGTQTTYTSYGFSGQQRVQMDGVNMTEGNAATSAYTDYSAFEEVQMGTSGNDASMPSPGVQVNFVVKSGGNRFHGDFYQDLERSGFQGTNISNEQLYRGAGIGTRITGYHDTNGDIGGPVKRDKLWFFTSFRRQYIGTTITGYPVEKPGTGPPFSTILSNGTYKLTYQLNAKNRISHMLNFERKQQPYRDAASTRYSDAVYNQDLVQWIGNLEWNSALSPTAFLNVRLGSWGYNWGNKAYPGPSGAIEPRRVENQSGAIAGGYNPQRYSRRRFQIEPTLSYAASSLFGLNHFFTFGFLTEKETYNFEQYPYKDALQLTFASAAGAADFTTPSQVTLYNTPALTNDYLRHNGAFAQDKIKLNRHLTLNLGVRWDFYNTYRPDETVRNDVIYAAFFYAGAALPNGYSIPATFANYKIPGDPQVMRYPHSFAPRVGLAWDVFGLGKTTLKIGYGRYYSNTAAFSSNVNPIRQLSYTFKWNDTNGDKLFQPAEIGAFQSSSGSALNTIDRNIRHPYLDDFNGFVEHQIGRDFQLRAGFVYRKLSHDWALVELARTTSLYTNPVVVTDPGPAGITPSPVTVWDIPATAALPASLQQWQTPDTNNSYWRNIEVSATRRMAGRWSMTAGFLSTWSNSPLNPTTAAAASNIIPVQPNILQYNLTRQYNSNFKVFGTYKAFWGLVISPIYRYQLGAQIARNIVASGLRVGSLTLPVTPVGSFRQDNVSIFDIRLEKRFEIRERYQIGAFFDAFNIGNSNAAQNQDNVTGTKTVVVNDQRVTYQRFLAPTTVISPRIVRVGVKFSF
jgi:hypothetical protein